MASPCRRADKPPVEGEKGQACLRALREMDGIGKIDPALGKVQRRCGCPRLTYGYAGQTAERPQGADRLLLSEAIGTPQHPFALEEDGEGDECSATIDDGPGPSGLFWMIAREVSDNDIRINGAHGGVRAL